MPSVDYYHGQAVESVEKYGHEDWQWMIRLSGGGVIRNYDERRTAIPEIDSGVGYLVTLFDDTATTLKFGMSQAGDPEATITNEVVLTPTKYSISDPVHVQEETFPQWPTQDGEHEVFSEAYLTALAERTPDGPTGDEDE